MKNLIVSLLSVGIARSRNGARAATVGVSKKLEIDNSICINSRTREMTCVARIESPPRLKKLSWTPIRSIPKTATRWPPKFFLLESGERGTREFAAKEEEAKFFSEANSLGLTGSAFWNFVDK